MSSESNSTVLPAGKRWKKAVADAYSTIIPLRANVASRIGTITDKKAGVLTTCADTGLVFYVALGIILLKFTGVMDAVIVAIASIIAS